MMRGRTQITWIGFIGITVVGAGVFFLGPRNTSLPRKPYASREDTQVGQDEATTRVKDTAVIAEEDRRREFPDHTTALSHDVRLALGFDGSGSFVARLQATRNLGPRLNGRERDALYVFLKETGEPEGLTPMHGRALKNDLLNTLRNQEVEPPELTRVMISLFHDRKQDTVVRKYALQHLSAWYPKAREKEAVRQVLWEALDETDTGIAGTALLGLYQLAQQHTEFENSAIRHRALAMATNEQSSEVSRLSALQVCGRLGEESVLPVARRLARISGSLPVRLSAIAILGEAGGHGDLALLEELTADLDQRVQPAAHAAQNKLRERNQI